MQKKWQKENPEGEDSVDSESLPEHPELNSLLFQGFLSYYGGHWKSSGYFPVLKRMWRRLWRENINHPCRGVQREERTEPMEGGCQDSSSSWLTGRKSGLELGLLKLTSQVLLQEKLDSECEPGRVWVSPLPNSDT